MKGSIVNLTHEGEENITSIVHLMGSQLFGTFVIPTDALTGPWNASVNQNGLYSNDEIQFTITDGPVHIPVVHNITPDSGMQGESTDYLLQGEKPYGWCSGKPLPSRTGQYFINWKSLSGNLTVEQLSRARVRPALCGY